MKKIAKILLLLVFPALNVGSAESRAAAAPTLFEYHFNETGVYLGWKNNSSSTQNFILQKLDSQGQWVTVATLPSTTVTYHTAQRPTPSAASFFRVAALANSSVSTYATPVYVTHVPQGEIYVAPLVAPSNVSTSPQTQYLGPYVGTKLVGVNVQWSDNSNNESGFLIQRIVSGGSWQTVMAASADATSAIVHNAPSSCVSYDFRVVAIDGDNGFESSAQTGFTYCN